MSEATAKKMEVSDTEVAIEINNMNKWYGDCHVLRDINLKVMKGTTPALDNGMRGYTITVVRAIRRQYNIISVQPGDDIVRYEKHTGHDPYSEKRLSY